MPSLTIRDIPEELLEQLRASAKRERRSLNSEVLRRLEAPNEIWRRRTSPEEYERRLAKLRAFTDTLPYDPEIDAEMIEKVLDEDRP